MDRLRDQQLERVLCLDADSGDVIWHHDYEARYAISYPAGPRCTPVVDGQPSLRRRSDGAHVLSQRSRRNGDLAT
jgi:hypothetical protein